MDRQDRQPSSDKHEKEANVIPKTGENLPNDISTVLETRSYELANENIASYVPSKKRAGLCFHVACCH